MNSPGFPRRATLVWLALAAATCATWWLGADHPLASFGFEFAAGVALAVAFAKAFFIGMEFMELRSAPPALRGAFGCWIAVVGGTAIVLSVW
ncbi:cytochrome C oxidase subunit IV family protein [Nocardia sp. CA-151230]|uniref:cytochrome C oxidase subunit IV family protein n=1 Tax=Nocardia sp. CA-151230 TaxID=3239982 RepID=UPI003D8EFE0D